MFEEGSIHAGASSHDLGNGDRLRSTHGTWELLGMAARSEVAGLKPRFGKWHGPLLVTEYISNQGEGHNLPQLK